MHNFLANNRIDLVTAATSAGTSTVNSGIVDMQGWDGVVFFTTVQTAAANNKLTVQQGAAANMSDAADLAGSGVTSGTSDEGVVCEVYRPQERYLRAAVLRGTSTALGEIWAIRYRGRTMPRDNSVSGTQAVKTIASPAEGTP